MAYNVAQLTPASAGVRKEAAWRAGKFTCRIIKLPPDFFKLLSLDGQTALVKLLRTSNTGEATETFQLVDKDTFQTVHDLPSIPAGQCSEARFVNGLGHVITVVDHPHTYFYVPEDGYKWLGSPPKPPSRNKHQWPQLPGFIFIGGQENQSESGGHLHVDGVRTQSPTLSIHERDRRLGWIRCGPWTGPHRKLNMGDESFCVRTAGLQ